MKQMKRAFAMLLCVAMVLSLCTMFAGAEDTVYGPYATLDEIPEDVNIFRSIRTGTYPYVESGDYYEFHEAGFPIVRIKRTAFLTQPTNAYLTADSNALAQNCKDKATKDGNDEWWSARRVCYYKAWNKNSVPRYVFPVDGSVLYAGTFDIYTASIYRLELNVRADYGYKVGIGVRLTSGVTFKYDTMELYPKHALKREENKNPLRPNVSVGITDNAQNVWPTECEITESSGNYAQIDDDEAKQIGQNALACGLGVVGAGLEVAGSAGTGAPVAVAGAAVTCVPLLIDGVSLLVKLATYSPKKGYSSPKPVDYPGAVPSPVKIRDSGNFVNMLVYLNGYYDEPTNFQFFFNFS